MITTFYIIALLLSASMSFLFSGIESGVLHLNRLRVRQQMREGNKKAEILFNYYRKPERFYWTILMGNIFSNGLFVIALVMLLKSFSLDITFWILFFLGVFTLFIFCDLLPKTLFRKFPNRLCIIVSRPFKFIQFALSPLVILIHKLFGDVFQSTVGQPLASRLFRNREELKTLMEESDDSLSDDERSMITRVLHLNERTLGQIAKPLHLSVTASADSPMYQTIDLCKKNQISRIPIWKFIGGQRKVIGITTLKTSLYRNDYDGNKPSSDYIQPALFLPSDLKVEAALKRMQRSGNWLAIVTSKSQREAGIIALQDILKVVFYRKPR